MFLFLVDKPFTPRIFTNLRTGPILSSIHHLNRNPWPWFSFYHLFHLGVVLHLGGRRDFVSSGSDFRLFVLGPCLHILLTGLVLQSFTSSPLPGPHADVREIFVEVRTDSLHNVQRFSKLDKINKDSFLRFVDFVIIVTFCTDLLWKTLPRCPDKYRVY